MDKILISLPNDDLGGAEQYLKMVAEYFYKRGYEVDVFFLKNRISSAWEPLANQGFKLYYTKYNREKFGIWSTFIKLFKNRDTHYRYIFTSHVHINSFISFLRRLRIIKADYHIARESTTIFTRFKGWDLLVYKAHYRINYGKIDLLICQTDFMLRQLRNAIPSLSKKVKIRVIPNPIDINTFKLNDSSFLPPYKDYIVSAGRLINEKGFDLLIEAFNMLLGNFPDLNLVILGEGKLRYLLIDKINQLGLKDKVSLPGFKKNVYPYFKNARLCVVSSRVEGFPNVLLQMMSQNSRVVSTLCAGDIEKIKGVVTCSANSTEELYHSMNDCLKMDSINNRDLFDSELDKRYINNFIKIVEGYLIE